MKTLRSALEQMEQEKGIEKEKILEAIEMALAAAYKKEYGKKGQIVRTHFDEETGETEFYQVKVVVDESVVRMPDDDQDDQGEAEKGERGGTEEKAGPSDGKEAKEEADEEVDMRTRYNPEHHILIEDARLIKRDAELEDEITFPLEKKEDFGRIAAQTAKQVIIQKLREAERVTTLEEFGRKEGEIVSGTVQRVERGNIFVDLGKTVGVIHSEEQIPRERYRPGERIRGYLYRVEDTPRGINLRISRTHPKFIEELFKIEAPEVANGVVLVKAIAREPGSRSKIAVHSIDSHIDPVGSCVGQRGVRVSTVMSELGGEKIDIIEWSPEPDKFIADALSPAKILSVSLNEDDRRADVEVLEPELSLAIGKGGQNARLAAKLTGWKIDIRASGTETTEAASDESEIKN